MQNSNGCTSRIRLAIAPGFPSTQLADLLARQRQEEPEVGVSVYEVSNDVLIAGLQEGRYDIGLTLQEATDTDLNSQPLWHENLAVAMLPRSHLLDKAGLTLDDLRHYSPIFRWQAEVCPSLDQPLTDTLPEPPFDVQHVTSFELLAVRVAAGYGVGITTQSRIAHARAWDICMRPLADAPYEITTYLVQPTGYQPSSHERLKHRALQIPQPNRAASAAM